MICVQLKTNLVVANTKRFKLFVCLFFLLNDAESLPYPTDAESLPYPTDAESLPYPTDAESLPYPTDAQSLPYLLMPKVFPTILMPKVFPTLLMPKFARVFAHDQFHVFKICALELDLFAQP